MIVMKVCCVSVCLRCWSWSQGTPRYERCTHYCRRDFAWTRNFLLNLPLPVKEKKKRRRKRERVLEAAALTPARKMTRDSHLSAPIIVIVIDFLNAPLLQTHAHVLCYVLRKRTVRARNDDAMLLFLFISTHSTRHSRKSKEASALSRLLAPIISRR